MCGLEQHAWNALARRKPARIRGAVPQYTLISMRGNMAIRVPWNCRVIVGRAADADVVLRDLTVSRIHAALVATEDGLVVTDLASSNGTYVDGVIVGESFLYDGDVVLFGAAAFAVSTSSVLSNT
jgi:pSer/pThr/pTyr-binding forkhead associated (FHA) protein